MYNAVKEGFNENTYDTVLDPSIPPWHPSVGITLPRLPKLFEPVTAQKRLQMSNQDRLSKFAFKSYSQGATDRSCWIIPGLLSMGCAPYGAANKRSMVDCVSALILSGLGTFVSVMEEHEETAFENIKGELPIVERMKKGFIKSRLSVSTVVQECEAIIEKNTEEISKLPGLKGWDETSDTFIKYKRLKLRMQARINMAKDAIVAAKKQLDKFPKSFDWLRVPIKSHTVPTVHEMLPVLWELEKRMRSGEKLFIYSKEGHGRAAMFCGALLGRLYGMRQRDVSYRLQACHDVTEDYWGLAVPINCPQLSIQRRLMCQTIEVSNRYFDGVNWRSLSNPDTGLCEPHLPGRGTD